MLLKVAYHFAEVWGETWVQETQAFKGGSLCYGTLTLEVFRV